MYKLIIGNVRITVSGDDIGRTEATAVAREVLAAAARQGKLVSHIEITAGPDGPQAITTERTGGKATRKTVKQSMLDGIRAAAREKLYPASVFAGKDSWFDPDTGQEWYGDSVDLTRKEIMTKLEDWLNSV